MTNSGTLWKTASKVLSHVMGFDFDIIIIKLYMDFFSTSSKKAHCVQCHFKLWAGSNEAAADWLHITLPVKLYCEELIPTLFFTAYMSLL